ncbi:MAG TPA: ABC transporter permease [Chitinophagaceae bacterium]|nr:ABC transporter permease [Chitinophagaceae bacterium]
MKLLSILWNSFRMSVQELNNNKLRSSLSLIGIAFGIFCIIGVLATVDSLKKKVQTDIMALGSNTIYIDKWQYAGGPDYPWWKFVNRPEPKFSEIKFIKEKSSLASAVCYSIGTNSNLLYGNFQINNITVNGVSEEFTDIQKVDIAVGRYLTENEFARGNPVTVIGYENAINLFGSAERALGKVVIFDGHHETVVGVIAKQGQSMIGSPFDFDHCTIVTYRNFASMYNVNDNDFQPVIMVKAKDGVSSTALVEELEGIMRQLRKLSPTEDDNFALNDINVLSQNTEGLFASLNIGGWAIAGLSLLVGAFGVANIMFVTVRERTSQIGLKKAVGAKKRTILTEFLLESAFLCVVGGLVGLFFVWILTAGLSTIMPFSIGIASNIIILAFSICVGLGILSGIIPASIAAKMNPVVAIRSK